MSPQVKVGCDLFLDLKLYQLPQNHLDQLRQNFPNIQIDPVNIKNGAPLVHSDMEIYWGNRITPEIISSMPKLKWIHFGSVGVNRAETKEVIERNIVVTNSRDIMTGAVASTALSMMLALARGIHHCWRLREEKNLTRESYDRYFDQTYDLEGQRCLIVGFGQIGKRIAGACMSLGMIVDTVSRTSVKSIEGINGDVYLSTDLHQAVSKADYVVNLLPLTTLTSQIYDQKIFKKMKKTAFFINVGRGESVVENDLIEALKSGTIAGAGLDVFAKEPLANSSELWNIPEVILTPHIGGLTNRYWDKQTALFKENLGRYLKGEKLINDVDMTKGY